MRPRKEAPRPGDRGAAEKEGSGELQSSSLPPSLLTREAAKLALHRVVTAATSPDVPPELRAELGLAARWLQALLSSDRLPSAGGGV
jgi:hypothetical protein